MTTIFGGNDNHVATARAQGTEDERCDWEEVAGKYGLVLLMQATTHEELVDLNGELPTDTHLVTFGTTASSGQGDAVRAYKMSDIFDYYADRGVEIASIRSGYGAIKPKLFVDRQAKEGKK